MKRKPGVTIWNLQWGVGEHTPFFLTLRNKEDERKN